MVDGIPNCQHRLAAADGAAEDTPGDAVAEPDPNPEESAEVRVFALAKFGSSAMSRPLVKSEAKR
jgi:hypothetical protein